jgi:CDP-diacylglycerol pyrophosphatase
MATKRMAAQAIRLFILGAVILVSTRPAQLSAGTKIVFDGCPPECYDGTSPVPCFCPTPPPPAL